MEQQLFKTKLRRVLRSGFFGFWRNGYVSLASILVMFVTLSVIGTLIFVGAVLNITLTELRNKVDVNVYFLTTAPEPDILSLQTKIESLPEVARVEYVSRDQVLTNFRERHANDQITLQALDELGENPFGASLNIKAREPSQYEGIANSPCIVSVAKESGQAAATLVSTKASVLPLLPSGIVRNPGVCCTTHLLQCFHHTANTVIHGFDCFNSSR